MGKDRKLPTKLTALICDVTFVLHAITPTISSEKRVAATEGDDSAPAPKRYVILLYSHRHALLTDRCSQ